MLDDEGYVVLPSLLGEDQHLEALERLNAIYAIELSNGELSPRASTTALVKNLHTKDPWFLGLLDNERLREILKPSLNEPESETPNYIVGAYEARSSGPELLGLHIDSHIPSAGRYTWCAMAAIALENRGVSEGCTVVVPGSHRSGEYPPKGHIAVTPLELNAGDAAIWDGRIWHGTLPRKSKSMGWSLLVTYQRWWIKPASLA